MTPVSLRRADDGDVEALLALWRSSRTPHAATEDRPAAVRLLLARSAVFVACDGAGGLVGAVIAGWDGWRGSMYRLAVLGAARRQGTGLALVREAEAWLIAQGANRISVLVAFEDEGARGLWRAAGYEADAVIGRMVRNV